MPKLRLCFHNLSMKQPLKCKECGKTAEDLGNVKISPSSGLCRLCALKHMHEWENIAREKGKEINGND